MLSEWFMTVREVFWYLHINFFALPCPDTRHEGFLCKNGFLPNPWAFPLILIFSVVVILIDAKLRGSDPGITEEMRKEARTMAIKRLKREDEEKLQRYTEEALQWIRGR